MNLSCVLKDFQGLNSHKINLCSSEKRGNKSLFFSHVFTQTIIEEFGNLCFWLINFKDTVYEDKYIF